MIGIQFIRQCLSEHEVSVGSWMQVPDASVAEVMGQAPLLIAMIEDLERVENLEEILTVDGLDAILIGSYDLSASMGITGQFDNSIFTTVLGRICEISEAANIACGIHVVQPAREELFQRIKEGYRFLPYSADTVFLNAAAENPFKACYELQ